MKVLEAASEIEILTEYQDALQRRDILEGKDVQ